MTLHSNLSYSFATDHETLTSVTVYAQCRIGLVDGKRTVTEWKASLTNIDITAHVDNIDIITTAALDCTSDELWWEGEVEDVNINILISGRVRAGCPAFLHGLPENCSPAEDDEVENVVVKLPDMTDITHLFRNGHFDDDLVNIMETWAKDEADYAKEMQADCDSDR